MEKEGRISFIIFSLLLVVLLVSVVSAGFLESFRGKISGKATNTVVVNVTVGKPKILTVYNNSITPSPTGGLTAGPSATVLAINFSVELEAGVSNMDNATATINVSNSAGTSQSRVNSTVCVQFQGNGLNSANYTCNVSMWWFDSDGAWQINASISDINGNAGSNASTNLSVGQTVGFELDALAWPGLSPGQTNKTSTNQLKLNNTGNKAMPANTTQINATNLKGETTSTVAIWAGNMSVSWDETSPKSCDTSGSNGTRADNLSGSNGAAGQFVNVTLANLTVGNYTIDNNRTGQEVYYFCIRKLGAELSGQSYSTVNEGAWTVRIL